MAIRTENPKAKPSKALSRDSHRPTLQVARLVERDSRLVLEATDSYEAVRVPVTANGDEVSGVELLPAPAVKVLDGPSGELELEGDGIVARNSDGATVHYTEPEANFPDFEELWPPDAEAPLRIGLNVTILKALAEAIGSEKVELVVDLNSREEDPAKGYRKAIHVRGCEGGGRGILMPVKVGP
jgi:hypothetical protein